MKLLDVVAVGMLDNSAYNAAETVANFALDEHREVLMDGPSDIRKAYKQLIDFSSIMP